LWDRQYLTLYRDIYIGNLKESCFKSCTLYFSHFILLMKEHILKYMLLLLIITAKFAIAQEVTNSTAEPMVCKVTYPAVYATEVIHGIEQRVIVQKRDEFTMRLNPNKHFTAKRDATILCFNRHEKIFATKHGVRTERGRQYSYFKKNHEMFDIAQYENENRQFVEEKFGIHRACIPYQGGEYCTTGNNIDIVYTKESRIKKLLIYGQAVYRLDFEPSSFSKMKVNGNPLGLWVADKNKKLVASKPFFRSSNTIIWKNPDTYIQNIVMIAKNGHLNIYNRLQSKKQKLQEPHDQLEAIEVNYILDDKAYKRHQKSRKTIQNDTFEHPKSSRTLPKKAKSTWGKYLNPKQTIPTNKFKAFYINTNRPKQLIASEIVDNISVNYPWKDFHNIDAKDFGGYWVGNFVFEKTQKKEISVSQSWSKTRIIIDGMVVYEGGDNKKFTHTFTKGKHKIEVEYVNNWHTVGFMVSIQDKKKRYSIHEVQKILRKKSSKESMLVLVGAYESKRNDQTITLKITKQNKPIILILNSYDAVRWKIENPHHVKIEAIIVSAYKPGVEITGNGIDSVPQYHLKSRLGAYTMKRSCTCVNGGADFHCEGREPLSVIHSLESTFNKKVLGYSVGYSLKSITVPDTLLTAQKIKAFKKMEKQHEVERKSCLKQSNPNFDTMFQDTAN